MAFAILLAALAAALQPTAPAGSCQAALGPIGEGIEEAALPGQVDGATIRGRVGLVLLRQTRGDALITVRGGNFARADFRRDRCTNICLASAPTSPAPTGAATDAAGDRLRACQSQRCRLARRPPAGRADPQRHMENANGEGAVLAGGRLDGGSRSTAASRFNLDRADLTGFRFECGIMLDDGCRSPGRPHRLRAPIALAPICAMRRSGADRRNRGQAEPARRSRNRRHNWSDPRWQRRNIRPAFGGRASGDPAPIARRPARHRSIALAPRLRPRLICSEEARPAAARPADGRALRARRVF